MSKLVLPFLLASCLSLGLAADYSAEVTISQSQRSAISPYIYGSNQDLAGVAFTARRQGGNRMTGYSWENNASNAGSDYLHQSDDYLTWIAGISNQDASKPGIVPIRFHEDSLAKGVPYSIVTLQLAGYVAKDKSGPVSEAQKAPSSRWVEVRHAKGSAYSLSPDTTDAYVYTDEFINLLLNRFGPASGAQGIRGYSMDNEPALWPHTHARIHPVAPTVKEIVARNVEAAKTVKRMDASAEVFGPALYGVGAYIDFQGANDWNAEKATGDYDWFIDYYLAEMKKAGDTAGRRLLDVLDVHLYSENRGGNERVTDSTNFNNIEANKARIQAPRSLYDPTFTENSWIGQFYAWTMPFLSTLQASIAQHYPGTKLALTEYNFGGEGHISGGIAQADTLGAFGASGVYLGTWWQLHEQASYVAAAFRLYRNYNGSGGTFGSTALRSTTSSTANVSAYASIPGNDDSRLHPILLNKNYEDAGNITLKLGSGRNYTHARVWGFDAASATITERASISSISGNQVTYRVPALTALHIVFEGRTTPPPSSGTGQLVNLSTRASVGSGDRVLVAGFYVTGTGTKKLLIRGVGPKLAAAGVQGALSDPQISLEKVNGPVIATNNDWGNSANASEVAAAVQSTGLPFDVGSRDAALVATVNAGPGYTVILSGVDGSSGIALAEVYDLEPGTAARLSNLSSRGFVGTGAEVMIAGCVVVGSGSRQLLVRAAGPALIPFNVSGTLSDPRINLTTPTGAALAANDDWSNGGQAAEISTVSSQTGAFAFAPGSKDAALVTSRPSGSFTAIVSGAGSATGVALVEVYEAP